MNLFPLWAVLFSVAAFYFPTPFAAMKPAIVPLLGWVMFGMGMTLLARDFSQVLKRPSVFAFGTALQFCLMPLMGWIIAKLFGLPPYLAAGLILVGCSPGGTASNVVCYLARGDVALSITLTSISTLLAFVATPFLAWLYIGQTVPVPAMSMLVSILKIVLLPVSLGILINTFWGKLIKRFQRVFPMISVFSIVLIIAIIVGMNQHNLASMAPVLFLCVVLHNLFGLACGYGLARMMGYGEKECRTLAIEVGMQNSGLSVALAVKYFSTSAALPGAIFSIWHNLSGSFLASYWRKKGMEKP